MELDELDTQVDEVEIDNVDESTEVEEDPDADENTDDSPEDEPLSFGDDDEESDELSDLAELIKTDPDAAVKRTSEVAKGLGKLKEQVASYRDREEKEAQTIGVIQQVGAIFEGVRSGDEEAIGALDKWIESQLGFNIADMAAHLGKEPGTVTPKADKTVESLKAYVEDLKAERAQNSWIADKGNSYAAQVQKVTGMPVTPQDIYSVIGHLKGRASAQDVVDAIEKHNPHAYIRLMKSGGKGVKQVPKSATVPNGRTGGEKLGDSPADFVKAFMAQQNK